jgi:hypothetical protein
VYKPININVLLRKDIIMAWQHVSQKVILKGFKKCCISNAVDETDNMLWNDSEDEVGIVSACEKDEGTDCEGEESDIVL